MTSLRNAFFGIYNSPTSKHNVSSKTRDKMDKIGMTLKGDFEFWILTSLCLNLTFSRVKSKNECHYRILRPKRPMKHASRDIHATLLFGDLIWPDLDLYLYLFSMGPIHICQLLHLPRSLLAKFRFPCVISPVLVADYAKRDDFDLWPHLDLTCDLFEKKSKFLNFFKSYLLRAFDCRLTRLVTAAGS